MFFSSACGIQIGHSIRNGEQDCGIFIAPLARGRWLHLWVDMESDNPDAFLRFRDVGYPWLSSKF